VYFTYGLLGATVITLLKTKTWVGRRQSPCDRALLPYYEVRARDTYEGSRRVAGALCLG
jgi:hypothetical protein